MNNPDTLMYEMFNKQRTLHTMTIVNSNGKSWYATLLTVLNNLELEHILHDFNITFYYLPCISLRDEYVQVWKDTLSTQPKLHYYKMFKNVFNYEPYLDCIKNDTSRRTLTRFRLS